MLNKMKKNSNSQPQDTQTLILCLQSDEIMNNTPSECYLDANENLNT